MEVLQSINLALRFLLELCVLVAVGYWGFHSGAGRVMKVVLGMGAPLLVALAWVAFVAPNAWLAVPDPWHLLLEVLVFGVAALALVASGQRTLAVVLALAFVINRVLMYVWGQ